MKRKAILLMLVVICTFFLISSAAAADENADNIKSVDIEDGIATNNIDEVQGETSQKIENDEAPIIDQSIGTYMGGNGNDKGKGVYTDADGNIYLAMETNSQDLKTTDNAYQANISGGKDLFVSKYSAKGDLIYSTFIGGSATEMQKDLKVDSLGNVYIIGFTNSANFPVTPNAFQKTINGSQDAFLTVLNPEGTGLIYSTFLGGSIVDRAWALAIGDNGTAYIQGITNSLNFPVTADAYQKDKDGVNWSLDDPDDITFQNSFDLFLSKLNIYSGELQYSTYFGARGSDSTYGSVAVDKNEVIYFAGTTTSIDFPTTENAFRDVRDADADSFLAALDIKNNKLIFSSYVGGNGTDDGEALVLSENGFLYYVGDTWSENFPTTEGAFQTTYGGVGEGISGGDMFIMKIDTSNWKLIYSTLLGGEFDEGVRALAVDEYENAWVVGMSQSGNYPVTSNAYQKVKKGPKFISYANSTDMDYPTHDAVISKISADGSKLLYSTYYGGNSGEFAMGITFADKGFILQLRTCSDDLFVTDNTTKGQDKNINSMLNSNLVYDFDSYLAVFVNPTVVKVDNIKATFGDDVNLTATVLDSMGSTPLVNKTVDFYINDELIGSAITDEKGVAILPYKIDTKGTLKVVFNETIGHAGADASLMMDIESLKTKLTVENSAKATAVDTKAGEKGNWFNVTLTDINGNPIANKNVQIAFDGKIFNVITNGEGKAGLKSNIAKAGTYTYAFAFMGDDGYTAADLSTSKLTVAKKKTSISAKKQTFKSKAKKIVTVTLKTSKNKADGKTYLAKGKKLTLTIKGKKYTAKINAKGVAKFTIKLTKKGKYSAAIKFAGDNTYKATSKKISIIIK
ncbi:SBBP repeat-containing protein [Methanobrevibacter sp.]|uniref:SBBP repeat-containing protein n=1 Tax=Methanobrevibacter sp. TaxID=66852 RepID=UPI0039765E6A